MGLVWWLRWLEPLRGRQIVRRIFPGSVFQLGSKPSAQTEGLTVNEASCRKVDFIAETGWSSDAAVVSGLVSVFSR